MSPSRMAFTVKVFLGACCLSVSWGRSAGRRASSGSGGFPFLCICSVVGACRFSCSPGARTGDEGHRLPLQGGCISQRDARMCTASFTQDPGPAALSGQGQGFWESTQFLLLSLQKLFLMLIVVVCLNPAASGSRPVHIWFSLADGQEPPVAHQALKEARRILVNWQRLLSASRWGGRNGLLLA